MDVSTLITALVTGIVVAAVSHWLTNRHSLLMKRELYREVLYREKVAAYREVYAPAADYVYNVEMINNLPHDKFIDILEGKTARFKKAVIERGLFMPNKVMDALGGLECLTVDCMEGNPAMHERFNLSPETPQELLDICSRAEQCESVMDELRKDLGVETLTADLGEFFRTATIKPSAKSRIHAVWEKIFKNPRGDGKGKVKTKGSDHLDGNEL